MEQGINYLARAKEVAWRLGYQIETEYESVTVCRWNRPVFFQSWDNDDTASKEEAFKNAVVFMSKGGHDD